MSADDIGWDKHYATEAGARYYPNEELVRFVSGRRFRAALDVGAGTGSNVDLLTSRADGVVACEPNAIAREEMHKRALLRDIFGVSPDGAKHFEIAIADARELPFGSGRFDLVVDCMTSQHIPWKEHEDVYREYARVLEPGGWLWLYHLDDKTRAHEVRHIGKAGDKMRWPDVDVLSLFPSLSLFCLIHPTRLESAVRKAGFTVDEVRGLAREYPDGQVAHYTIIAARKN